MVIEKVQAKYNYVLFAYSEDDTELGGWEHYMGAGDWVTDLVEEGERFITQVSPFFGKPVFTNYHIVSLATFEVVAAGNYQRTY